MFAELKVRMSKHMMLCYDLTTTMVNENELMEKFEFQYSLLFRDEYP